MVLKRREELMSAYTAGLVCAATLLFPVPVHVFSQCGTLSRQAVSVQSLTGRVVRGRGRAAVCGVLLRPPLYVTLQCVDV
jgi:hypothetical protein